MIKNPSFFSNDFFQLSPLSWIRNKIKTLFLIWNRPLCIYYDFRDSPNGWTLEFLELISLFLLTFFDLFRRCKENFSPHHLALRKISEISNFFVYVNPSIPLFPKQAAFFISSSTTFYFFIHLHVFHDIHITHTTCVRTRSTYLKV